jgi:hypothetical protein
VPQRYLHVFFASDPVDSLLSVYGIGGDRDPSSGLSMPADGSAGLLRRIHWRGPGKSGYPLAHCLLDEDCFTGVSSGTQGPYGILRPL